MITRVTKYEEDLLAVLAKKEVAETMWWISHYLKGGETFLAALFASRLSERLNNGLAMDEWIAENQPR